MLKRIDCVMFRVEDVDAAVAFYRDTMGLAPLWRAGTMAGLEFPDAIPGLRTELVLHNDPHIPAKLDVNYMVDDVRVEVTRLTEAGCRTLAGPFPIAIGQCAVIEDPFGNALTLVDMTTGPRTPNLRD